ncbi:MAG: competence/damage-inducible protein A [Parvibaculaceae bacterium]
MIETSTPPTAAVLVIGDEILSGRTKDKNLGYIADWLAALGIDLKEARIVSDIEEDIVAALNALRSRYTYVFTTGGIGPTHDDITADSVARAFGVPITHHPEAVAILQTYFAEIGREANEARMRMARTPVGAELIPNAVSKAPGFRIGNVFVMAGVPRIMQAMLDTIAPLLRHGTPVQSRSVTIEAGEGDIAIPLKDIQARYPEVVIGSYPKELPGSRFAADIVLRSRDETALSQAASEVDALRRRLDGGEAPTKWT